MSTEHVLIYVDGQPVETQYIMKDDGIAVPAHFFKYAGVEVDFDLKNKQVVFRTQDKMEKVYNNITSNYISLQNVTKSLGLEVVYDARIMRLYLITNISPDEKLKILYRGDLSEKRVALTFDDGPDYYSTPKILDILSNKGVKATFFVVGQQVEAFPRVLERIVKEGHEIGNHTWSHRDLAKLSTNEVIKEIKKTEEIIQSTVGIKTNIFRAPFGLLTTADLNTINRLGLKVIAWNIDTIDYMGNSAEKIINIVTRDISPGSIILQHSFQWDIGILDESIKALPIIIDQLQSQGMEFVPIKKMGWSTI